MEREEEDERQRAVNFARLNKNKVQRDRVLFKVDTQGLVLTPIEAADGSGPALLSANGAPLPNVHWLMLTLHTTNEASLRRRTEEGGERIERVRIECIVNRDEVATRFVEDVDDGSLVEVGNIRAEVDDKGRLVREAMVYSPPHFPRGVQPLLIRDRLFVCQHAQQFRDLCRSLSDRGASTVLEGPYRNHLFEVHGHQAFGSEGKKADKREEQGSRMEAMKARVEEALESTTLARRGKANEEKERAMRPIKAEKKAKEGTDDGGDDRGGDEEESQDVNQEDRGVYDHYAHDDYGLPLTPSPHPSARDDDFPVMPMTSSSSVRRGHDHGPILGGGYDDDEDRPSVGRKRTRTIEDDEGEGEDEDVRPPKSKDARTTFVMREAIDSLGQEGLRGPMVEKLIETMCSAFVRAQQKYEEAEKEKTEREGSSMRSRVFDLLADNNELRDGAVRAFDRGVVLKKSLLNGNNGGKKKGGGEGEEGGGGLAMEKPGKGLPMPSLVRGFLKGRHWAYSTSNVQAMMVVHTCLAPNTVEMAALPDPRGLRGMDGFVASHFRLFEPHSKGALRCHLSGCLSGRVPKKMTLDEERAYLRGEESMEWEASDALFEEKRRALLKRRGFSVEDIASRLHYEEQKPHHQRSNEPSTTATDDASGGAGGMGAILLEDDEIDRN